MEYGKTKGGDTEGRWRGVGKFRDGIGTSLSPPIKSDQDPSRFDPTPYVPPDSSIPSTITPPLATPPSFAPSCVHQVISNATHSWLDMSYSATAAPHLTLRHSLSLPPNLGLPLR
ncbi:hypothetical protein FRC12_004253 [Ceratobasidium sp. 428]|nr:hypothetical protein FRC12_004253 [Ceratobasidium sp. 428]